MYIRKENLEDKEKIFSLVTKAFKNSAYSDGNEQYLVNKLRDSEAYIQELSIVALDNDKIIGHVMFSKLKIEFEGKKYETLALAPISISPKFQKMGIGTKLINYGLRTSRELGYKSVFVLGDNNFYERFGFKDSSTFNIKAPFNVPSNYYMALELEKGSLNMKNATIIYPKEFFN